MDHEYRRHRRWGFRLAAGLLLAAAFSAAPVLSAPALPAAPALPGFSADLLWSGSLEDTFLKNGAGEQSGSLSNRGDLRLHAFGFDARAQVLDRRPFPPWENTDMGNTALSGGLYHRQTGSRLLYGLLEEWGLPARLRNPWGKSVPAAETRRPSAADLRTTISTLKKPQAYLYLGSPPLGNLRFFGTAQIDGDLSHALSGGLEATPAKKTQLGIEGFYTGAALASSKPSAWFSEKPPLPERDFKLYGLNLFFNRPLIGLSSDLAYSETFAFGRDMYGSLALRLGDRPWRFSLGADGAGSRFSDRDGTAVGAGFRSALTVERRGKRSSLFRAKTSLRAEGLGEPFDRSDTLLRYRFPGLPGGKTPTPFGLRPSSIGLSASRKTQDPEKTLDSLTGSIGFSLGPVRAAFDTGLTGIAGTPKGPYPGLAASYDFNAFTADCELAYSPGIFQFRTKLGYTKTDGKDPVWDTSFSAALRGKFGRFSLKMASPHFPHTWTCTLSWRAEKKGIGKGGNSQIEPSPKRKKTPE
ncbi:MAG: hypothetical protein LBQ38_00320 [Spirochaetaceae bacterium]|jgi:hypothetical protein|nr:hypothetical protein [Spirochaetaceae bacterium]